MALLDLPLRLFHALPAPTRERIKKTFRVLGHGPSLADGMRARLLAGEKKRLDRSVEKAAARLSTHGFAGLQGKTVLEYGVGYLLSDVIAYHLAGADRVIGLDYHAILDFEQSRRAFAGADRARVVAALSPHAAAVAVAARLDALGRLAHWDRASLAALGIDYLAPCDLTRDRLPPASIDLVHSVSTFEHVPAEAIPPVLAALGEALAPGGLMVHSVHLADHRDIDGAPFAFLAEDTDWTPGQSDARGNRLRVPDWERIVAGLEGLELVRFKAARNERAPLPARLAPQFRDLPEDVLRTDWLQIALRMPRQ